MKTLCFVLPLVLAASAEHLEKRIVGSKTCHKDRMYHVQIESVQGGKSCGGSLLNTRWVITASHCAEQTVKVTIAPNLKLSLKAKLFFKGESKKHEQEIPTDHQFTFKDEEEHLHDIMLIKLNEGVHAQLPTIELPPVGCSRPEPSQQVEVGGWGSKTSSGKSKIPNKLRCASADIVACGEKDKPDSKYHSDEKTTMCGFKPGVEVCFGDGGSGVEYNDVLHGIIVSNPVDKCTPTIVMQDICNYREWIDKTMRDNA